MAVPGHSRGDAPHQRAQSRTLGQGWHLGRPHQLAPGDAGRTAPNATAHIPLLNAEQPQSTGRVSLFQIANGYRRSQRSTKPLLIEVSKMLERQALHLGPTAVLLGAFEDAAHFTPATSRRYATLAEWLAFVGAVGAQMPAEPAPGVRGAHLTHDDPVLTEWHAIIISPHFHAALIARDVGDTGHDNDRRFDYILTHDPAIVIQLATQLIIRMLPSSTTTKQPVGNIN